MDPKDIKKRDVWTFDEFAKSYDQARKTVMTKKGENAHPGAHTIKAEGLYTRNDANVYKAAGIEHNEAEANVNDRMNANRVHVFDGTKDRVEVITGNKALGEGAKDALDVIINTMQTGVIIDESVDTNKKTDDEQAS